MKRRNRREFLKSSAVALAAGFGPGRGAIMSGENFEAFRPFRAEFRAAYSAQKAFGNEGKKPLRLGLIIGIGNDPDAALGKMHALGLPTCQAYCEEFPPGLAKKLTAALERYGIEATSIVVGGPGKEVWEFYGGPLGSGWGARERRAGGGAQYRAGAAGARGGGGA